MTLREINRKGRGVGRVPHVRPSVRGPKMTCFKCFHSRRRLGRSFKAFVGLRPSYSAHVRWGEHGAPVLNLWPH